MRHRVQDCDRITEDIRAKGEDELPYSIALKAESTLIGKECLVFDAKSRKSMQLYSYTGKFS